MSPKATSNEGKKVEWLDCLKKRLTMRAVDLAALRRIYVKVIYRQATNANR